MDEVSFAKEETIPHVSEVSCHLLHPLPVGVRRYPTDAHAASGDIDDKQDMVANEPWYVIMELKITPSGQTIAKPTALGPGANTDTKLLIYGLFQKGRVLAQDDPKFNIRRDIPLVSANFENTSRFWAFGFRSHFRTRRE